jgi:hypothetical protein
MAAGLSLEAAAASCGVETLEMALLATMGPLGVNRGSDDQI